MRAQEGAHPVVVVSAMSRVTDALLASVQRAADGQPCASAHDLDEHFERHLKVAHALLAPPSAARIESLVESAHAQITELLRMVAAQPTSRPLLQDVIASYGERLSASLLAAVLCESGLPAHYVDARRCIVTDECHGGATPYAAATERRTRAELEPLLAAAKIPVLGGFIAAANSGETTTLGRGGSDYTASLVGAALSAREIQIWTDVPGILTADPRLVTRARTISRLSYAEAAELAYFGAKVLHPKTIQPAVEQSIPVRICNSHAPEEAGTLVCSEPEIAPRTVKAIAHRTGITTLQVISARMLGAHGFLRALFEIFDRHRTVVDVITTSEVSVSLSLDDVSELPNILREVRQLGAVEVEADRTLICIVGEGLRGTPGIAARAFNTISDINISLISQGASSVNLTFVIDEARGTEAVRRLHEAFFERANDQTPETVLLESKGAAY